MTDPDVPFQRDSAEVFSSPHSRKRGDDYQRLLRGEIESEEYVRRLRARMMTEPNVPFQPTSTEVHSSVQMVWESGGMIDALRSSADKALDAVQAEAKRLHVENQRLRAALETPADALIENAAHELYAAGPWGEFYAFADDGIRAISDAHSMGVYRKIVREVLAVSARVALDEGEGFPIPDDGIHPTASAVD